MQQKAPIYTYTTRAKVVLALIIASFIVVVAIIASIFGSPVPLLTYIILGLFIYYTAVAKAAPFGDRLRVKPILGKRREYFVAQGVFSLESKPTLLGKLVGSKEGLRILYTQEGRKPVVVMNEFFAESSLKEIYAFLAYWQAVARAEEHNAGAVVEILG